MVTENSILSHIPDLVIGLVGIVSQLFVGHRLRIPRVLNGSLALMIFLLSLYDPGHVFSGISHLIPATYRAEFLPEAVTLWWWFMTAAAIAVAVRDRLQPKFHPDRRAFLTASTSALCALPAATLGYGIITRKNFHVKEIDIEFPNLPKDLRGLRLLQLSDIHMSDFFSARDLGRVVDASNELRADLIFVTGDLITTKWDPLDVCIQGLSRLRAPAGIWGCMGNHELHAKAQRYTKARASEFGMRFLRQEAASLKFGNSTINLVGVDYQRPSRPYLETVDGLVAPGSFNLLLSHNPDVFPVASRKGFDLTLAGHTHGGQINVEVLGSNLNFPSFFTPYTKGLYTLPNSRIYVNSGLGTIGVPVRLGAPAEITLIRLCNS